MSNTHSRREFFGRSALGASAFLTPGVFAEHLLRTPTITEGPFYPDKLPLDTDNDLLVLNDSITPAVGEITLLSGRVLTKNGSPIRNAFVELWQVDANGSYLHKDGRPKGEWDGNFQGYGRFLTDSKGRYHFRTIKPVPYPGRTPHIHMAVSVGGKRLLTTQCFINGHAMNARDGLLRRIRDPLQRESVLVDFKKVKGSKIGELEGRFDIVLGHTLVDRDDSKVHGVAKSRRAGGKGDEGERFVPEQGVTQLERYLSLDANKDRVLSAKELPPRMRSLLLRADKDANGAITVAELEALIRADRGANNRRRRRRRVR